MPQDPPNLFGQGLQKLEDVSKNVTVSFANAVFDRSQQTITADVCILNTSKDTLSSPLKLRVLRVKSELGTATIVNPEAREENSEGVLDFSSLVTNGVLRPGEPTGAKYLVIRIADLLSGLQPSDYKKVLSFVNLDFDVPALPLSQEQAGSKS